MLWILQHPLSSNLRVTYILYIEIKFLTLYKMALKIAEFDVNYITAVKGKSVNGLKFANFRYKSSDKFPWIIVYGGMRVEQGKFGITLS